MRMPHDFLRLNRRLLTGLLILLTLSAALGFAQGARIYSGKPLSIDLSGDIRDFFKSVASVSDLHISIDPSIKRDMTVHLKDVPWDLALDTVLKTSGLAAESDGTLVRVAPANPLLSQDHVLMGTVTIEGKVIEFHLQNPRTNIQVNAPGPDGAMQTWSIDWESAEYLSQLGLKPDTLKVGEQVIITGNLIRPNTMRLIIVRRTSNGFSWGDTNVFSSGPPDGVMFVSAPLR